MKDLHTSVVALLVSEACNIGLTPVTNPGVEALTRSRLVHVDQYYLRADTIAAANAALIAAQAEVPIVRYWGGGLLASVDGLRFVVPVRTISAAPSLKYFGFKRGITWLNAVNDQVAVIGQMVVPGTPRDSLHILDALLNLDGGVKPEMVATDNASYSDMVFGLFKILGYNFSPRFRDLDDQRCWRATMPGVETGTYGPLEDIARDRINLNKVIAHWPDMLRVAGSLVTNQVRAYDLLRMFGREGRPTPLGQAFAEYGRIAKTLHLLAVVDPVDDTCRRQMNRQLTVLESRHKLARDVCHGKRGTIRHAYRDGMEDQLGSLGLVLNAVVLWTTKYIDAAVSSYGPRATRSVTRMSPGCLRSSTRTSTCSAATASPRPSRSAARCARCVTQTPRAGRRRGRRRSGGLTVMTVGPTSRRGHECRWHREGFPTGSIGGEPFVQVVQERSRVVNSASAVARLAVATAPAAVTLPHSPVARAVTSSALSVALTALAPVPHGESSF
ncbi:transposase [Streptomyces chartreusis]|uniref:Transposase n=1 Tax=Streptomyces chartreusis TaxID=1969 RepID=A0A7H8TBE4_STRCX|nr:Tn3 family transposase [Streptomyces chartreusis]QKZ20829.1 transposase [Streptomyces chartreusis]